MKSFSKYSVLIILLGFEITAKKGNTAAILTSSAIEAKNIIKKRNKNCNFLFLVKNWAKSTKDFNIDSYKLELLI